MKNFALTLSDNSSAKHRVYTQSGNGVHSIMMEKSALVGESWGARPPPLTLFTITYKVAVYAPAERADTLRVKAWSFGLNGYTTRISSLPYLYSVVISNFHTKIGT